MSDLDVKKLIIDLENIKIDKTKNGKTQSNSQKQTINVNKILQKHNFIKVNRKIIPQNPGKYYISQPNGTQRFPDYHLYFVGKDGKKVCKNLETKTGKKKIMWNDSFPRKDSLYLFSCQNYGKSKLFTGGFIKDKDYERYKKHCENTKKLTQELKVENSCFNFYTRKAISQKIDILNIKDSKNVVNILKSLKSN